MSLRRYRYFEIVAEELHIGRAAERLGIAQPALSQQMKVLEADIGVALLHRVGRGIELTDAGAALLPEVRALLAQDERARKVARQTARGELGRLTVGYVNTAMLEPALPALLNALRGAVPGAQITLEEIGVREQIAALTQRQLDVAVVRAPAGALPPGLRARGFTRSPLLAVVPSRLAAVLPRQIRMRELAGERFILLRDPHGIGLASHVATLCARAGFAPSLDLRVNNATSIIGLVAGGFGVSVVPAALSQLRMEGVAFLGLLDANVETRLLILDRPADAAPLKRRLLELARHMEAGASD